jgi:hypothetical protein
MAGNAHRAVPQLVRMLERYSPITRDWLGIDRSFNAIRGDPEFQALMTESR